LPALLARPDLYQFRPGDRRNGRGRCDFPRRAAGQPDAHPGGLDRRRPQAAGYAGAGPAGFRGHYPAQPPGPIGARCASLDRLGTIGQHAMRVELFDFELPPERIALRPARPRDAARMLVVPGEGELLDRTVRDLPALVRAGDVLVFNDTR